MTDIALAYEIAVRAHKGQVELNDAPGMVYRSTMLVELVGSYKDSKSPGEFLHMR